MADGTLDALVSDHTPVDADAKALPFAEAEPGATGLELLLGLALSLTAAYAFSRYRFAGRRTLMLGFLLINMFPLILLIIPLFVPTCRALGIDMVHFGVVAVVNCMIGLITPPYGVLLFVVNAITGISLKEMISEIWSFIGVLVAALLIMILASAKTMKVITNNKNPSANKEDI